MMLGGFMTLPGYRSYGAPPDFASMPVEQKKQHFFQYLAPIVSDINSAMSRHRERIARIRADDDAGVEPNWRDARWLQSIAKRFDVPIDEMERGDALEVLERRAGTVPEALVLAQAAIESGWGTSRFAVEGNNYFGQRCYETNCGIAPAALSGDVGFGLAAFDSVAESIESYILNLNSHPEYREFRQLRQRLRAGDESVTGLSLLAALEGYSERGAEYLDEVRAMILANNLE